MLPFLVPSSFHQPDLFVAAPFAPSWGGIFDSWGNPSSTPTTASTTRLRLFFHLDVVVLSQPWDVVAAFPALGRQEDPEFKVSLGY
jgi:hypothetical protein